MPARRSADPTPDLFSAPPAAQPSDPPISAKPTVDAETASEFRHLLPQDLAGSLRRLGDDEIDRLLSGVTAEAERRGRLPKRPSAAEVKAAAGRTAIAEIAGSLTKGKLNAVRAAFKAGVKPAAIARQFGISQSDVRKALAQDVGRGR